ncbi:hypothetical protein TYRP_021974 [Tyrophagus putrescentiae]|nr:hypothetical protein TYRP_021974 [Tyrophagus putrescentiae]
MISCFTLYTSARLPLITKTGSWSTLGVRMRVPNLATRCLILAPFFPTICATMEAFSTATVSQKYSFGSKCG